MTPGVPSSRRLVLSHGNSRLETRFLWALALTTVVLVGEVAGGVWTHSLALLSDAMHVLMDVVALGLSYVALRMAARAPSDTHSYGFHRAEVLAAMINGGTLLVIAAGIFWEAARRVWAPEPVKSLEMLAIAAAGLAVNLVVLLVLRGPHEHGRAPHEHETDHEHAEGPEDLNLRSAWLHVVGDTLSSVGVILAGLAIWGTGWMLLDPLMSVAIGAVLLFGSGRLLKAGVHILMEGVPEGLRLAEIGRAMAAVPGVREVHDLHVWSLCHGSRSLSAHVTVEGATWSEAGRIQAALKSILRDRFRIEHTTIQLEGEGCPQGIVAYASVDGDGSGATGRDCGAGVS